VAENLKNYVVYNAHLDEFVKVRKFNDELLGATLIDLGEFLTSPGSKIRQYVKRVVSIFVDGWEAYDYDEVAESLFECVIEVYPLFQIDVACKTINDINSSVEEVDVIPCSDLQSIHALEKVLNKKIIGQSEAIDECIKVIKLIGSGMDKFVSMFFIGNTGVGKTELARLLASDYLGDSKRLLKINCAEYASSHEYAKLIGSPPGYIGHNENGILSDKAAESSRWIICFDEIEKAHSRLKSLLLSLLDEGKLMDSHGNELDFSDSLIIFTSNIGIKGNVGRVMVGFGKEVKSYDDSKEDIEKAFKDEFSPEFINRLDSIIHFNALSVEDAEDIAKINLKRLPIRVTKRLISYVVEGGFSPEYGARNIKRFIKNNLTVKIAEKILEKGKKSHYKSVFKNGTLSVEEA
tara:strand:+ start:1595 stop:2812 length:1218 start_codon:yes stop_codon:yes gene_type:complete